MDRHKPSLLLKKAAEFESDLSSSSSRFRLPSQTLGLRWFEKLIAIPPGQALVHSQNLEPVLHITPFARR